MLAHASQRHGRSAGWRGELGRYVEILNRLGHGRALVCRLDYAEALTFFPDDGDVSRGHEAEARKVWPGIQPSMASSFGVLGQHQPLSRQVKQIGLDLGIAPSLRHLVAFFGLATTKFGGAGGIAYPAEWNSNCALQFPKVRPEWRSWGPGQNIASACQLSRSEIRLMRALLRGPHPPNQEQAPIVHSPQRDGRGHHPFRRVDGRSSLRPAPGPTSQPRAAVRRRSCCAWALATNRCGNQRPVMVVTRQ